MKKGFSSSLSNKIEGEEGAGDENITFCKVHKKINRKM